MALPLQNIIPQDKQDCERTGLRLWLVVNGVFQRCVWAIDKEDAIRKVPLTYANAYEIKQERN